MDGGKPIGQDAGTRGTVMSVEGLLAEANGTDASCPQVDTGQVGSGDCGRRRRTTMISKDQAESMVTMLDTGWTLAAIAAHFGIDVKEVEQAIVKRVKSERKQVDDQRRGK